MRRRQGSIAGGIIMLVLGALFATGLIFMLAFFSSNSYKPLHAFQLGMFIFITVVFIVSGILLIVRGRQDREIIQTGHPGRCTIEEIHWMPARYGRVYTMTVSFKGDDGFMNETVVPLGRMDTSVLKVGMVIECIISDDRCYVDARNINIISNTRNGDELE